MESWDEVRLARRIERLGHPDRAAFAAACAQLLQPFVERYAETVADASMEQLACEALSSVWSAIQGDTAVELDSEKIVVLIPDDSVPWTQEAGYAQNALAAVAYAMRTVRSGSVQEAVWAARQVYDLADLAAEWTAQRRDGDDPNRDLICSHEVQSVLLILRNTLGVIESSSCSYSELRSECARRGLRDLA